MMQNSQNSTKNTSTIENFVPPRHWVGPEELNADYWTNPSVVEKRAQEFHDKPVETVEMIERLDSTGVARRDFLTIMGASMAMASFACARRPVHKIIPYVVKPEEITGAVANYYASTCADTGLGILIKVREGRPIKVEGNPDHPMSMGALSARTQSAILSLYDPERIKAPMVRDRGNGSTRELSWADADLMVVDRLKKAVSKGSEIRFVSAPTTSPSMRRLMQEFMSGLPRSQWIEFDPCALEEVVHGQVESYGTAVTPAYRFDEAEMVVSIGADFLGTWPNAVENMRQWSKGRKLAQGASSKMSKLICFESGMSLTGANADERYPLSVRETLKVAMAIAHHLFVVKKYSRYATDPAVTQVFAGASSENVYRELGFEKDNVRPDFLAAIADKLWEKRGKSLVLAGGLESRSKDAVALQIVVNLLNSALENEGATVDGTVLANLKPNQGLKSVNNLIREMNTGSVGALIIFGSNPTYTWPDSLGFDEAIKKVETVIVSSERDDESAQRADLILSDLHYLENWGDANPRNQLYSVQQPAIAPIHNSRAFQDGILAWMQAGVSKAKTSAKTWHDYVKATWLETFYKEYGIKSTPEQFWEGTLREGLLNGFAAKGQLNVRPQSRVFKTASLAKVPSYQAQKKAADSAGKKVVLALYSKISMHDGQHANNPWLQELPDPISTITWDNYLNVAPETAKELKLAANDVVKVTANGVSLELPVHIQPGQHRYVVTVAIGYGRRNAGKVGNEVGLDVLPFVKSEDGMLLYSDLQVEVAKTGRRYQLAETQWHHVTENRPVINDISLSEYKHNPKAANHTDPHLRMDDVPSMWPKWEYKGYRWGMAIDLNSCTGCGACVIGCQSENNIPVVGRDNVRRSREMHWIRIDRYFSGNPDRPSVVFQPMLCQHCENAPCETVCPVLATVHSTEGLNEQVYNRCVGTRYCQNNCPYKVRRFNFFDHWKAYDGTMNLAWNPDVTVRTRGIMEKCTFCVQRIREVKDIAKDHGNRVKDGEIKTACQQTCPTDAIVFGDINDPESRVSKLQADQRAYRVLEVLNVKPVVSYLTKVRNVERSSEHSSHGG